MGTVVNIGMGALAAWNACAFARFEGLAVKYIIAVIDSESGTASGSVFVGDEYMSGFWLVDADTPETARRLAAAASRACNRKVELRPFLH